MTKRQPIIGLIPMGDSDVGSCVGDFCEVPDHHQQAIVNRRLYDDNV